MKALVRHKANCSTFNYSRRGTHKRVVHVPIKEVEGSRLKGETNAPPADSWAWRKYGQKPIKGSPYPRYLHYNFVCIKTLLFHTFII